MECTNEILFISSYPPRECGIATYSQDLLTAIKSKFEKSFVLKICALENNEENEYEYPEDIKYVFKTNNFLDYIALAEEINSDEDVKIIFLQHEFGLFSGEYGENILYFLRNLKKPVIVTFHTVLPDPSTKRRELVNNIIKACEYVIVMTRNSASILKNQYDITEEKITIIHHGTHLVPHVDKESTKTKMGLENRFVLSTFGLLSSGKCIETALDALPSVIEKYPEVIYLILGKTHPGVINHEGEKYRDFLKEKIDRLHLHDNVKFVNRYLSLNELLEYLQLTDIYLFTSKDPHQAVSGTFSYAMGCSCPIISTPIPHAKEMLSNNSGVLVDFHNSDQLSQEIINLRNDDKLRHKMALNGLHSIRPTAWQNSAIAHAKLFKLIDESNINLNYEVHDISLAHIKRLTTRLGMIQFSTVSTPDLESGYTLDDNSRALVSVTRHYEITKEVGDKLLIDTYLNFIRFCQLPDGRFLNYVDKDGSHHIKNGFENLEDSEGRAIWALGEFIFKGSYLFHDYYLNKAEFILVKFLLHAEKLSSPRAIAFTIKGLYHYNLIKKSNEVKNLIIVLADNLISKYRKSQDKNWCWFEDYMTYANSVLPEAMLYAYLSTEKESYKLAAKSSFDFLLTVIFSEEKINVISNNGWLKKGGLKKGFGQQPIDVAYTILALDVFHEYFNDDLYKEKLEIAFSWFNGNNHLNQIVYNPSTGGCQDGLEEHNVNLNQGAESTVCYLMARCVFEKYANYKKINSNHTSISPKISLSRIGKLNVKAESTQTYRRF